jgi:hypothetical protein
LHLQVPKFKSRLLNFFWITHCNIWLIKIK